MVFYRGNIRVCDICNIFLSGPPACICNFGIRIQDDRTASKGGH